MTKGVEQYWRESFEKSSQREVEDYAAAQWSLYGLNKRMGEFKLLIPELLKEGSKVLDLGCGPGTYTVYLASKGFSVTSIDYSENMLLRARKKVESDPSCSGALAGFSVADARAVPIKTNTFDAAVCYGMFQHLTSIDEPIRELFRVLKPGATCIINTLNRRFILKRSGSMLQTHDPRKFQEIGTAAGFQCVMNSPLLLFPKAVRIFERLQSIRVLHRLLWPIAHDFVIILKKPL